MGMVALDWAEKTSNIINQFGFVFLISLRHVDNNIPLESIILEQHGRLHIEGVTVGEIKSILSGSTGQNILLLMDGYDEYTSGCNEHIDELLMNGKDHCLIILSSRPGDHLKPIKPRMDEEVAISGFSYENIIKCAEQYLASDKTCQDFLFQAEKASIHTCDKPNYGDEYDGLLHIPIILLMACTVFSEKRCLPSSKIGLFKQVVHMCMSRTTLKTMGKTASEVESLYDLMVKLGQLAWEALNRDSKQLLIHKVYL